MNGRTDDWACEVRGRVESVSCLRSEKAVYHRGCFTRFYLKRKRTFDSAEETQKKLKISAEQEAIEYLEENENSYLSIADLQTYMGELTGHRHIQLGGLKRN